MKLFSRLWSGVRERYAPQEIEVQKKGPFLLVFVLVATAIVAGVFLLQVLRWATIRPPWQLACLLLVLIVAALLLGCGKYSAGLYVFLLVGVLEPLLVTQTGALYYQGGEVLYFSLFGMASVFQVAFFGRKAAELISVTGVWLVVIAVFGWPASAASGSAVSILVVERGFAVFLSLSIFAWLVFRINRRLFAEMRDRAQEAVLQLRESERLNERIGQEMVERQNAERALRQSEERLRLAARSGRVGVWEYDPAADNLDWDDLMHELHGLDRSQNRAGIRRWWNRVHPDDLRRIQAEFHEFLQPGGKPFDSEFRVVRADDGETRHIRALAGVVCDQAGKPVRAIGTNWDVTENKRREEALRLSEQRSRNVIEQSNDAIYILFQGRFDLVNRRFCEMTGVTPEEARAPEFNLWDLVAPESIPLIRERQEARMRGEEIPGLYEFEILHREGRRIHVEASVTEIEYRDGKAILGLLRDVTEQRALEAQLNQTQRMESIGRLSGGVAHDLNNLLTPIIGYGEILGSDSALPARQREAARQVVQAAFRARDLVRQLLAFSRRQTLEFRPIDLNEMVSGFENLLRRTIREDIRIEFRSAPSLATIQGDRGQLEQVIMNLAVNAQDAMPDGGVVLIETSQVELDGGYAAKHPGVKPGTYVMLAISDSGHGMDDQTRERVFEPFFTTKDKSRGAGLGLATVYGIVKQHGGHVWVYSEPGEGATFKCYFPAVDAVGLEPELVQVPPKSVRGHETVMVVEDETLVRQMVVSILLNEGYSVLEAEDGEHALRLLENHQGSLHLLLTDVVLPGMNGKELFRRIVARFPGIRVLYMSGYTDNMIAHRGVLDEGVAFLQKPFSGQGLRSKVRQVLEQR